MQILLENVRLAFPSLFEPRSVQGNAPRFSAVFIIDPASKTAAVVKDAVKKVASEKWGAQADAVLKKLVADKRVCYKTDPRTNKDGEVYAGFEGMHSLNASNKVRPAVIDRNRTPLTATDGRPYAGCYVNAIVDIWAQDSSQPGVGRRINCTLMGVQFVGDGEPLGGATSASPDAFPDLGAVEENPF